MRKIIVIFMQYFAMVRAVGINGAKSNNLACRDKNTTCAPYFPHSMTPEMLVKEHEEKLEFKCRASGKPAMNFTWTYDGKDLNRNDQAYILKDVKVEDEGNYTCRACNELGCISHTFQLHVEKPLLVFKIEPKNDTAKIGQLFYRFQCVHNQPDHLATIEWFFSEKEIIPKDKGQLEEEDLEKKLDGKSETYEIRNVSKKNEGWYSCRVYTHQKTIFSSAYLTVESHDINNNGVSTIYVTASICISLACLLAFGSIRYYKNKRTIPKLDEVVAMRSINKRKIIIQKQPKSETEFEVIIQRYSVSSKNDDVESGDPYKYANYEIPSDEYWNFPRENIQLMEKLGEGAFGIVHKAKAENLLKPNTSTTVAIKMLKNNLDDDDGLLDLVSEMQMMKVIGKHKNIIGLLGHCTDGQLWVLMEYAALGNLQNYLKSHQYSDSNGSTEYTVMGNRLNETTLIGYAIQIAEAMNFLASKKCIHRDLAARNVLVTKNHVMKVADFGLTRYTRDKDYYHKEDAYGRVPFKWMAPESLYHQHYTTQSDVWSFGIVLWEIMSMGSAPYGAMSNKQVYDEVKIGLRLDKPDSCSIDTYLLMQNCWSYEPLERPTFSSILTKLDDIMSKVSDRISTVSTESMSDFDFESSSSDSEDEFAVESSLYNSPFITTN